MNDLITSVQDHIGTVTFNRPEQRNALTPDMLVTLKQCLESWAAQGSVRTVIFTGSGDKAFSSGFDIRAIPTGTTAAEPTSPARHNPLLAMLSCVKQFPYPTIAMLNGQCFGAALNLAICCDIRVATQDVVIGMPPAKLGIVYHPEGIAQFVSVLGMARAREVFLTGRSYAGAKALEMGLVNQMVARAELRDTTFAMAREMAANAPLAVRGMKYILNALESAHGPSENELAKADELINAALNSADLKEAQQAFLAKRSPKFVGS